MRWEELFADLEAHGEAAAAVELAAEVSERARIETAALHFTDRLRPAQGHRVVVATVGATVRGLLLAVGSDWVLLEIEGSRQALVRLGAVLGVTGLGAHSSAPGSQGRVAARLGLASALRAVARDRAPVVITRIDGSSLSGTVDRVGGDFLEIAEHPIGEARRKGAISDVRTVPFTALAIVGSG